MILVVDNLGDESWGRVLISFWGLSTVELWTGLGLVRDCSDCKGVRVEEFKGYGWLEARCMLVWVRWLVEGMGNERVMRSGSMVLGWDGCAGSLLNGARGGGSVSGTCFLCRGATWTICSHWLVWRGHVVWRACEVSG